MVMMLTICCSIVTPPSKSRYLTSFSHLSGKKEKHLFNESSGPLTTAEAELVDAFKIIIATPGNQLNINGIPWNGIAQVQVNNTISYNGIRRLLLQPEDEYKDVADPDDVPFIQFDMANRSEIEFQESDFFQTTFVNNKMIQAVDLHCKGQQGLYYKRSSDGQTSKELFTRNVRPDVASLVLPMILELKSDKDMNGSTTTAADFEVLLQSLQRLQILVDVKGYLTRAFCFAISSRNAYLISYQRDEECFGSTDRYQPYQTFNILKLCRGDICKVWCLLTNTALRYPSFFISKDAVALQTTLDAVGVSMQNTRVCLASCGTSNVYFVTTCDNAGRIPLNSPTLAIKINRNLHRHALEVEAQKRIAAVYISEGKQYYVLGCCTLSDHLGTLVYDEIEKIPVQCIVHQLDQGLQETVSSLSLSDDDDASNVSKPSWFKKCPGDQLAFGAIVMHPGRTTGAPVDTTTLSQLEKDLRDSFAMVSKAKVWHTDYRSSNLMYFPSSSSCCFDKWIIIDFDLSVCHNDSADDVSVVLTKGSPRGRVYEGASKLLLDNARDGDQVTIPWNNAEELAMLVAMIFRIRANGALL